MDARNPFKLNMAIQRNSNAATFSRTYLLLSKYYFYFHCRFASQF